MVPELYPCGTCGVATNVPCADWCPDGMSDSDAVAESLVCLAQSIARFVRRERVRWLCNEIRSAAQAHADAIRDDEDHEGKMAAGERFKKALAELAELAMEGTPVTAAEMADSLESFAARGLDDLDAADEALLIERVGEAARMLRAQAGVIEAVRGGRGEG